MAIYGYKDLKEPTFVEAMALVAFSRRHGRGWKAKLKRAWNSINYVDLEAEPDREALISLDKGPSKPYLQWVLNGYYKRLMRYRGFRIAFAPVKADPDRFIAFHLERGLIRLKTSSLMAMKSAVDDWHTLT